MTGFSPPSHAPKKPNHERWVISYADLLTLLLAFFVVLYASSTRNSHKEDQAAASFLKAFQNSSPSVVTRPFCRSRNYAAQRLTAAEACQHALSA